MNTNLISDQTKLKLKEIPTLKHLWRDMVKSPWYLQVIAAIFLVVSIASFFWVVKGGTTIPFWESYQQIYASVGDHSSLFGWGNILSEGTFWTFKTIGLLGTLTSFASILLFFQSKKSALIPAVIGNTCMVFGMIASELSLNTLLFLCFILPVSIVALFKWSEEEGRIEKGWKGWIPLFAVFIVAFLTFMFLQSFFTAKSHAVLDANGKPVVGEDGQIVTSIDYLTLFNHTFLPEKNLWWLDLANNATYVAAWYGLLKKDIRYLFFFFMTDFLNFLVMTPVTVIGWGNLPMSIFFAVLVLIKPIHFWYWYKHIPIIKHT